MAPNSALLLAYAASLLGAGPPVGRGGGRSGGFFLAGAGLVGGRRGRGAGDFFVAGRALPARLVFATLLAANIGAGSTVGAAGLGYRYGLSARWWSGSAAVGGGVPGLLGAPRMHPPP